MAEVQRDPAGPQQDGEDQLPLQAGAHEGQVGLQEAPGALHEVLARHQQHLLALLDTARHVLQHIRAGREVPLVQAHPQPQELSLQAASEPVGPHGIHAAVAHKQEELVARRRKPCVLPQVCLWSLQGGEGTPPQRPGVREAEAAAVLLGHQGPPLWCPPCPLPTPILRRGLATAGVLLPQTVGLLQPALSEISLLNLVTVGSGRLVTHDLAETGRAVTAHLPKGARNGTGRPGAGGGCPTYLFAQYTVVEER